MAQPRRLQTSSLSGVLADDAAATASPARGAEMRDFLQARLQKNRVPSLVHSWDFYHDRQDRSGAVASPPENKDDQVAGGYAQRLERLASIDDVRQFWSVFNNFEVERLALRDSVHLFHRGVKPLWEDPRNVKGGSWTFRVPKPQAAEVWKNVCMMAIGEQLQAAVEDERKMSFRDDICGISLSVRFNSMLIQVWNRDADHENGIQAIKDTILQGVGDEFQAREGSYYYKKHSEHAGFTASA